MIILYLILTAFLLLFLGGVVQSVQALSVAIRFAVAKRTAKKTAAPDLWTYEGRKDEKPF